MSSSFRLLLTGSAGFVGQAVYGKARQCGWHVTAIVRRPETLAEAVPLDLTGPDIEAALRRLPKPDAVAHLASPVDFSPEADEAALWAVNVAATRVLATLARDAGAAFFFASSIAVHGPVEHIDIATSLAPQVPYARSKAEGEAVVRSILPAACIVRLPGIFGRHGPAHLGLNKAIDAAIDEGRRPELFGSGEAKRNYAYVDDVADCIMACLMSKVSGSHLLGGPAAIALKDMLADICEMFLGGGEPVARPGTQARDHLVDSSAALPAGRSFIEALRHIRDVTGAADDVPAGTR